MNKKEMKLRAFTAIDAHADRLIAFGQDIQCHPELGYKEYYASSRVEAAFGQLVSDLQHCAGTGLKGWLFRGSGPRVAVIGELDAVLSPQHPLADPVTGAAHACGHFAQLSTMLGCALGLQAVQQELTGSVCLIAAPAEEYVEIGWRSSLRREGKINYLGGKQQLISEGAFDDIDMAMMVHGETDCPQPTVFVAGPANGFIGKDIRFVGREAHAGGAPWDGVNALNAASLAISAINAHRETFREEDRVRVHPIITKGGDIVNTVPADVRMESYVRAASIEAMQNVNKRVNRAVRGAAYAIGAEVQIDDMPGYLPLQESGLMSDLFAANAKDLLPDVRIVKGLADCGSTDIGDVAYLLPTIQPLVSGFTGGIHSKDFTVVDENLVYLVPAKLMAATVIDLLCDGAGKAQEVISGFQRHTKEEYQTLWENILNG